MATSFKRPGVYVEESLLQITPDSFPSVSAAAFVGISSRGPVVPTRVETWVQYERLFGGFSGTNQALAHAVFQFYNNGGGTAYVVRSIGTGAVTATRTLVDRAGTPVALLKVDAINQGAWGNLIFVEVTDVGGGLTGRFNLVVRSGGAGDQFIVERWTDISMDPADNRYAISLINSPTSGSIYIRTTNMNVAAYVAATHTPALTIPVGGDALASGADGSAPTGGAAGQLFNSVATLAAVEDFLTINVPAVVETALINAIITFIEGLGTAFLVVDTAPTLTPAQAVTAIAAYTSSSFAAAYYPNVVVSDPSNSLPGSTRTIPPGGVVVGQYAATDAVRGVHKAPAGINTRLNGVVALETKALDSELDALNVGKVNALRSIPGVGFCIFGARTFKINQIDRYVNVRRTLLSLRIALVNVTRFAAFEPNDTELWDSLESAANRVLLELWQEGGLRGATAEEAFYVKCDADTNTVNAVNNGEVRIEVGVALQSPAEFIVIKIGQFESGSTVNEEV